MRKLCLLFGLLLLIGSISAASIDYQIIGDKVFVEADFGNVKGFEFRLPYDTKTIESKSNFEVINFENYKILKVNSSKSLTFSYITESLIEQTSSKNFFILKSYFNTPLNVTLYLPEAGVLMEDFSLIFPENAHIDTDGRRVFLEWGNFNDDEIVVGYEILKEENNLFWYLLFILIIGFVALYFYQFKKLKKQILKVKKKSRTILKKRKKDVTRNLFGEEKRIIEYLMEKKGKESWTKEISKDLDIPKVRLSRKLRNLIQKELIEKIPYGNENRIKLLKIS